MTIEERQNVEYKIAKRLVEDAIKAGYTVSVDNLDEVVLKNSTNVKSILDEMFSVDEEHLIMKKDGKSSRVLLVYGNDGTDVIADYHSNLEHIMAGANEVSQKLERKYFS